MANKFKVGDAVRVLAETDGWGDVKRGAIGTVVKVYEGGEKYDVDFEEMDAWSGKERCFEMVKPKGGKKMAKKKIGPEVEERVQKAIAYFAKRTPGSDKPAKEKKPEPVTFETKLALKVKEEGGCQAKVISKIIEDMFGLKLPAVRDVKRTDGLKIVLGTVVVPTDEKNGHDYEIGDPCMIIDVDERRAVNMDGNQGNHLDGGDCTAGYLVDARYATAAEIEKFARSKAVMQFLEL
jgi:hypothetical protein